MNARIFLANLSYATLALLLVALLVAGCFGGDKALGEYKEARFRDAAPHIQGVKRVIDYLDYEDGRHATVELDDGKRLSLSGFDLSIFGTVKGKVFLDDLDGIGVACVLHRDEPASVAAIDIASLLKAIDARVPASSLDDLASHADQLKQVLASRFPESLQDAKPIRAADASGTVTDHWCHLARRP